MKNNNELNTPKSFLSLKGTSIYLLIGGLLIFFIFLIWFIRQFTSSFFTSKYQRVNIGIWGKRTIILSYNLSSPDHSLIVFSNSYEIEIPGGLKGYTVGAIGKLVDLERKPLIFKKALSSAGQLLIHKTQHENTSEVYFDDFGDPSSDDALKSMIISSLLGPGDLNVLERIYIFFHLSEVVGPRTSRAIVTSQKFEPKLYEKVFRNERKLVQLQYQKSSKTAYEFASMLENIGIRVSDVLSIDRGENRVISRCEVIEQEANVSETAKFLSAYFDCRIVRGETGIYNIKLILDQVTESEWGS